VRIKGKVAEDQADTVRQLKLAATERERKAKIEAEESRRREADLNDRLAGVFLRLPIMPQPRDRFTGPHSCDHMRFITLRRVLALAHHASTTWSLHWTTLV
jgi:hypothetical protein